MKKVGVFYFKNMGKFKPHKDYNIPRLQTQKQMITGRIRDGYGMIQRDVMTSNLSQHAKLVYCLLVSYAGQKDSCYPSLTKMCRDLKAGRSTIVKAIDELIEEKLIEKETKKRADGGNSSNTYYPMYLMATPSSGGGRGAVLVEDYPSSGGGLPPVLVEDSKNNSYKNNIEDSLNPKGLRDAKPFFDLLPEKEKEKEKEKSCAKKEKSTHAVLMDIYWEWYKGMNDGVTPVITKADGQGMSMLTKHLEKIARDKQHPEEDITNQCAIMLQYIFNNWDLLRPFEQSGVSLRQINSNINNIINQIKNGKTKTNGKTTVREMQQAFSDIDRMFEGK